MAFLLGTGWQFVASRALAAAQAYSQSVATKEVISTKPADARKMEPVLLSTNPTPPNLLENPLNTLQNGRSCYGTLAQEEAAETEGMLTR